MGISLTRKVFVDILVLLMETKMPEVKRVAPRKAKLLYESEVTKVWLERLEPGHKWPLHRHNHVHDNFCVVRGTVTLELREPEELVAIRTGEHYQVAIGRAHRSTNVGPDAAEWILVQGAGDVDTELVEDKDNQSIS